MKSRFLYIALAILTVLPAYAETPKDKTYGQIPLSFEANHGQLDSRVRFLSRGPGYGVFLTDEGALIRLVGAVGEPTATVHMKLVGGKGKPDIEGVEPTAGKTNYLTGSNPGGWFTDVATYSRVRYAGVYPGIDLTYYGNQRQLEYDFMVRPGSRPETVRIQYDGVLKIEIDSKGDLILKTAAGDIRQPKPIVYQEGGGRRIPVDAGYVLRDRRTVGFRVGEYNKTMALTIDPVLVYASYFGGTKTGTTIGDQANAIAVDAGGNVYVTGVTSSTDLLVFNAAQTTQHGGTDAFIFKLDPTGTAMLYSTYFGGLGNDEGHSIAVDGAGNAYITGYTSSDNLPTTPNASQKTRQGNQDAYLLKLSPAGNSILYSTFLGGSGDDRGLGVALDPKGGIYIAGMTSSTNFPTANAFQGTNAGGLADVFVTKFGPTGTIQYSTYVGGRGNDESYGIAVDPAGGAYVVGFTTSGCPPVTATTQSPIPCDANDRTFPRVNALQPAYGGGSDDAFIFKLNPAGNALEYSTYYGGRGSENATRVTVNAAGYAFFTGYTSSDELSFPILNPIQFAHSGGFDAFITCLAPDGKSVVFSTFFGGEANDSGVGIALDAAGSIYVAGYSDSILMPTVNAFQSNKGGTRDGFILKLDSAGKQITYATYVGGSGVDGIIGLAVDGAGNAYVAGYSYSLDFPVVNPFQPQNAGGQDSFVAKLNASDIISKSEFTVSGLGGTVVETSASSLNPAFGYATAEVANGGAPTGLEILSLNQGGVTTTEVGLLAPPLTKAGRLFVEVASNIRSVVSIANPNDDDASVDIFFTNASGESSKFATQKVAAHAHFSAFVTDPPFSLSTGSTGTVSFTSDLPIAAAAFRTFNNERGDFLLSATPIADPSRPIPVCAACSKRTIPHFADGAGWDTAIILVNPTEDTMRGEIQFVGPGGEPLAVAVGQSDPSTVFEYEVLPRSFARFQTPGTVTSTDTETGEMVTQPMKSGAIRIAPFNVCGCASPSNNAPDAHAILEYKVSNITVFQTPVPAQLQTSGMRLYAEASGTFDFDNPETGATRTAVAIANPLGFNGPVTVRLALTRLDGTPTGLTSTIQIPPGGRFVNFIHQIPGFQNLPLPFKGILTVNTVGATRLGDFGGDLVPGISAVGLRTFFNERSQFLATTTGPINEDAGTPNQLIFPHIAEGGGYSTEFILIGRNGQGAAGTLKFFTQEGTPLHITRKPQ